MGRPSVWKAAKALGTLDGFAAAKAITEKLSGAEKLALGKNALALPLARRDQPVHLVPTNKPQPWELMPTKVAAFQQYPNFFGSSCMFFGSISRDVSRSLPSCLLKPSKLGLDLAKLMRNLGIISSFEVFQRMEECKDNDFVWPQGAEPSSITELSLYKHKYIKLNLRWDQHRPVWVDPNCELSQTPMNTFDALPLSVKNLSKPSRPMFLTPDELRDERDKRAAGIFIMYHPELGLTTDSVVEAYNVPALALAHVGLPYSHVVQIRGALRQKYIQEKGLPLAKTKPLHEWSMVEFVRQSLQERAQALDAAEVKNQKNSIEKEVERRMLETERLRQQHDISQQLHREIMAWQLSGKQDSLQQVGHVLKSAGQGPQGAGTPLWGQRRQRQQQGEEEPGAAPITQRPPRS